MLKSNLSELTCPEWICKSESMKAVLPPRFPYNNLDEPEKKTRINQTEAETN